MSKTAHKVSRRAQILSALAQMLADSPGERITTSALARAVGVSEAALYRHFPSKTKMFEGLIEFIEQTVFSQVTLLLAEEKSAAKRCEQIVQLLLVFAEQNPGMSRLLIGDALTGETERLRQRIVQFFARLEAQVVEVLQDQSPTALSAESSAHLLMVYVDGAIVQFVRSEFQRIPSQHWAAQWQALASLMAPQES